MVRTEAKADPRGRGGEVPLESTVEVMTISCSDGTDCGDQLEVGRQAEPKQRIICVEGLWMRVRQNKSSLQDIL